ncbi:AraC family transcriptional regulator [Xanthobacter autotrophicus]|uniref:helix-turn-helix transcriptional regulator n=1 Tax=Xanthobacter TaxID=279 RepID=UPI0024AA2272|nr:AraC family transcriptional regulator [Xanthobacter autotrophicus]MDI4664132.1 AraC family transcriptional regulator [Xanthobacter autotrophicus]
MPVPLPPMGGGAVPMPGDAGRQVVRSADIAALSHLAGTQFVLTAPRTLADGAVLRGRYLMTSLRSGAVLHATDARHLHDLTSQVVHARGITLGLFLEGHADVQLGGRPFRFGPARAGEAEAALLVRAEPGLFVRKGQRGQHVRKVNITIPADWLEQALFEEMDRSGTVRRISADHLSSLSWRASPRLVAMAEQVLALPPYGGFLRDLYMESRVMEMLFEAFCAMGDAAPAAERARPRVKQRMWQVQEYLEARLCDSLSLDAVAQEAGMSVTSLQRAFRATFGTTVFDYVRGRRLERARDALLTEGVSVTEAATIAGYSSAANFSTAFKRAFGMPPKAVR